MLRTGMSVGARLCSLEEIMGDETRYTGCGFDDNFVWTSSTSVWNPQGGADGHGGQEDCSTGSAVVAMGASLWTSRDARGSGEGSPPACRTMLGESAAVRCCADARRMCFDQGGQGSETHAFAGVSRHDIAGTWVAFFQKCQQYRVRTGDMHRAGVASHLRRALVVHRPR